MHDTWAVRDLPVLDATIRLLEHSYMVTVSDIAAKTELDPSVVAQALDALNPVYVDFRKTTTGGDPRFWYVFKVTPEARRAVGQWPSAEALVSRLVAELSAAARHEGDAENQGLLVYAARLIGDTLRDATLRAAGAVLAPAFGGLPVPEMGHQVPPPPPPPDIEFDSLVPLPELPELLRPQRADSTEQATPVAQQPEPAREAPVQQTAGPAPTAPKTPEAPVPEAPVQEASVPETSVPETSVPETSEPESAVQQAAGLGQPGPGEEKAAAPTQPSTDVPDLNPWPERPVGADSPSAALNGEPLHEATPFRSSLGAWPAADGEADTADTAQDLVQLRRDAV